jgi:hypothetical protein
MTTEKKRAKPEAAVQQQQPAAAKPPRKPKGPHGVPPGSDPANRLAAAILEVLAGIRTPSDAAQVLEVSLPRYYQLETRAVAGLVEACEPRPVGKQPSLENRLATLERELEQARREAARQQTLVRVAHRSLGLKAATVAEPKGAKEGAVGKGRRRKRRPVVRALKAAAVLRKTVVSPEAPAVEQPQVNGTEDSHQA